jgi:glycosyltransferase involved in cell wall biosynthesis
MRILHIAQSISGGIASYFEEIAKHQTRLFGVEAVRFLIPKGNHHHIPSIEPAQIAEFAPCERSVRGLLALARATHREIENFAPTILHLHSTFAGAIARPVTLLSKRRPRVVYCAHGWVFAMELPAWKRKLYARIEKSLVPLADTIVNISHSDHQLACTHGIPQAKMRIIRNGIAATPPSDPKLRAEFGQDGIHLIFVGRHDRQKGLDFLLKVFAEAAAPSVHLHIVGAPVLEGGTSRAELPANITFYGWQSRDAVSQMIASADALIMPSRWEGFGFVALEAMRMGKPVISSRRGALMEIIEHGKTGLHFDLDRQAELRDILRELDKARLAEMGKAARAEFLQSYTSDRLNAELTTLYQSLHANDFSSGAIRWRAAAQQVFKSMAN